MAVGLWIAQVSLLVIYVANGIYKIFWTTTIKQRMAWASERTVGFLRGLGAIELLGGLGVVLPMLTGVLPWLTPLAALGLSLIQILAISTVHFPRKEYKILPLNLYFLAISIFVLIGRWSLIASI